MRRVIAALALGLALSWSHSAAAQSNPGWTTGFVPSAAQWNAEWGSKSDFPLGAGAVSLGSSQVTGTLPFAKLPSIATNTLLGNPSASSAVPGALSVPSCSGASNALTWTTNTGFGCNTIAGGGGTPGGTSGQVQFNNAGSFGGFTLGGDATLNTSTGALTVSKTNGVAFGTAATVNTGTSGALIPLLSTANTWTLKQTFSTAPTLGSITGSTQCLHVDATGAVSGTGADCGSGGGSGTVTSVGLALPSIFSVTGSPVTASGTLTGALATQSANTIFAGPSTGTAAAPTFRALAPADLPQFSSTQAGAVSASGGGTANFLRADGTWAAPSGSGAVNAGTSGQLGYYAADGNAISGATVGTGLTLSSGTLSTTAPVSVKTTAYTVQTTDAGTTLVLNSATAATFTGISAATLGANNTLCFADEGSGALTLSGFGTVYGLLSSVLPQNASVCLQSDGTNYAAFQSQLPLGAGLSVASGSLAAQWSAGVVTSLGSGLNLSSGVLTATGAGGGTVTGGGNEGAGVGVFDSTNSTATTLQFKTLVAGSNITLTDNGASGITVAAAGGGGGGGNPSYTLVAGRFYAQPSSYGSGSNAIKVFATPFYFPNAIALQTISVKFGTTVNTGTFCLGLYSDNSGTPGTLLASNCGSVSAAQESTSFSLSVPFSVTTSGLYWVVQSDTATANCTTYLAASGGGSFGFNGIGLFTGGSSVANALPSSSVGFMSTDTPGTSLPTTLTSPTINETSSVPCAPVLGF